MTTACSRRLRAMTGSFGGAPRLRRTHERRVHVRGAAADVGEARIAGGAQLAEVSLHGVVVERHGWQLLDERPLRHGRRVLSTASSGKRGPSVVGRFAALGPYLCVPRTPPGCTPRCVVWRCRPEGRAVASSAQAGPLLAEAHVLHTPPPLLIGREP